MSETTVLIVEDEAIIAADLSAKLGLLGYRVVGIADRGEDAVAMACSLLPSLVLMDIRLKGAMDGVEAAEAIRRSVDLPVIYLTAHSDTVTLDRAKVSEPFGYLLKPFEERELTIAIEMALFKYRADRELREQREWLRVTLASIGDAVITCDTAGRTTYLNPVAECLSGWTDHEAKGLPIGEVFVLIDELTGQPTEDPVAYVLRERRTKILANHTALVARDGRTIPIEDSAAPILADDGRVIGVVLVFHDVTEKRRAQEALQTVNEEMAAANEELLAQSEELIEARRAAEAASGAKSLFLANMSHELRTPMAGLIGMLDLVLMENKEPQQRDCLVAAQKAAHSMVRILNDILDITSIEAGRLSLEEKTFSLSECVRNTYDLLVPAAMEKNLELGFQVASEVPDSVIGDQARIRQVLTNLAANAVKFTGKGRIEIRVAAGEAVSAGTRSITFTVADTGIGIPDEKKELLFQEFSQVDGSHSRSYGGTGLGLAISREIVKRMAGTMTFESEEGKGSSFSFTVPLRGAAVQEDRRACAPIEQAQPEQAHLADSKEKKPRLLLAEDDPTIGQTMLAMLERFGYEVDLAENGRRAVEAWQEGSYDLILMDVQMPVMNGFEAVGAIREIEVLQGGHIPVIAVTAHVLEEDRKRCLAAGMDGYLAKPIDFQQTLKLLAQMVARRHVAG